MPNPVGLGNNVNYIGNNYPNVGDANNIGNVGNVGNIDNVGNNVAPGLDAAGKANAIYKASVVATEIDVLITKAAASSVGSLDGFLTLKDNLQQKCDEVFGKDTKDSAAAFDNNAIRSIQNTAKQLTSSFYARITA